MCTIHKGFSGFKALSHASILDGNLIALKHEIPYDTILNRYLDTKKSQPHKLAHLILPTHRQP